MVGKKEKSENLGNRILDVGNSIKERFRATIRDSTEFIKRLASEPGNGSTMRGWQQQIITEPGLEGVTRKGNTDRAATITVTWHGTVATVAGK